MKAPANHSDRDDYDYDDDVNDVCDNTGNVPDFSMCPYVYKPQATLTVVIADKQKR